MSPTLTPAPSAGGTARQSSDPTRSVPTRRVSFEESLADLPRHFTEDGDLVSAHVIAMLSSVFPDGEDFFVRSVRHYRDQITDPELRRQVAGFIGQESVHGREHRVLNDRLAELGYPTRSVGRLANWFLTTRERLLPAESNLALTAALEHFTATLAELLMTDEDLRRTLHHPAVQDVFVWHALEESEHKAVAFDVYRAVGGREWVRVLTMKLIRAGFVAAMAAFVTASLLRDRATYRRGNLRASLRRFRSTSLVSKEFRRALRDYDRRDFHPDDRDTDELVARWREELFGDEGRLVPLLAGRPAEG